jgi:hypothetical protein
MTSPHWNKNARDRDDDWEPRREYCACSSQSAHFSGFLFFHIVQYIVQYIMQHSVPQFCVEPQMKLLSSFVAWLCLSSTTTTLSSAFVVRPTRFPAPTRHSVAVEAATLTAFNMTTSMTFYETTLQFPQDSLQHDTYSGIALHVQHLHGELSQNPIVFSQVLEASLNVWRVENKRGIWIHIPKSHAHLIQPSLEAGFDFHFCEADKLVLKQWLPNSSSRLPLGPTHQVGVGALVLEDGKMLVVRERSGPAAGT